MKITDYKKIKEVTFKYPELMKENASEQIKNLFNTINKLEEEIADTRAQANIKEKQLNLLQKEWNSIKDIIDIEYETYEKDYTVNSLNVGFKFSADINKNIH